MAAKAAAVAVATGDKGDCELSVTTANTTIRNKVRSLLSVVAHPIRDHRITTTTTTRSTLTTAAFHRHPLVENRTTSGSSSPAANTNTTTLSSLSTASSLAKIKLQDSDKHQNQVHPKSTPSLRMSPTFKVCQARKLASSRFSSGSINNKPCKSNQPNQLLEQQHHKHPTTSLPAPAPSSTPSLVVAATRSQASIIASETSSSSSSVTVLTASTTMINELNLTSKHTKPYLGKEKAAATDDHHNKKKKKKKSKKSEESGGTGSAECQKQLVVISGAQKEESSSSSLRKRGHFNNQNKSLLLEPEVKSLQRVARVSGACSRFQTSARSSIGIMCWPSWRQLIVLSLLSIIMTSLLANLNIINPSSSSCRLLFNHCHALSVVPPTQTTSGSSQPPTSQTSAPLPALPVAPVQQQHLTPTATSNQQQQSVSSSSSSTSTSRPRHPQPSTSASPSSLLHNHHHNLASSASTTAATTATPSPPSQAATTNVNSSQSQQMVAANHHVDLLVTATPIEGASNKLGLAAPSPAPSGSSSSSQQVSQQQQHKHRYHAKPQITQQQHSTQSNRTSDHHWPSPPEVDDADQDNSRFSHFGGSGIDNDINTYHTILTSNYDLATTSSDENNNNNNTSNNNHFSSSLQQRHPASSITRDSQRIQSHKAINSGETRRKPQILEEREGTIVVSGSTQQYHRALQQPIVPISPQQSSNQAIKVVEAPNFVSSGSGSQRADNHRFSNFNTSYDTSTQLRQNLTPSPNQQRQQKQQQQQLAGEPLLQLNEPTGSSALNLSTTAMDLLATGQPLPFSAFMPPMMETRLNQQPHHHFNHQPLDSRYRYQQAQQVPASGGARSQLIGLTSLPQELLHTFVQLNAALLPHQHEPIFGSASANQPLFMRPQSLISALAAASEQQQQQPAQQLMSPTAAFGNYRQLLSQPTNQSPQQQVKHHQTSASASAPSISLPPLSHFLVPRNPFRLFSSSSAPMATRYRPSLLGGGSSNTKNSLSSIDQGRNNANNQQQVAWSQSQQQSLKVSPFQGMATSLAAMDQQEPTRLYAHSHSAEQLERLVRAASQATGIRQPILPAIVSAPHGTIPGFYIPAIESESEESQVNEMRHGDENVVGSITSKIPGTDYVLHPEEVRAMMSIGESAWRKQQSAASTQQITTTTAAQAQQSQQNPQYLAQHHHHQQQQMPTSSSQLSQSYSTFREPQQQSSSNNQQQQQQLVGSMSELLNNWNTGLNGYMQENHIQNARDFAYIDPGKTNRRDINNNNQKQHLNSSLLESQLNHHFQQNNLNAFPAIIRVNDQDYVHWPLIKLGSKPMEQASHANRVDNQRPPEASHHQTTWSSAEESRPLLTRLSPFQALYQAVNPAAGPSTEGHNSKQSARGGRMHFSFNPLAHHHNQQQQQHHHHSGNQRPQASNQMFSPVPFQASRLLGKATNQQQQESSKQETRTTGGSQKQQKEGSAARPDGDLSPVRLATQLTPNEIRQVEDSIIETLIVAQTLERQRKMMHQLAASLNQPVHVPRPSPALTGGNNKDTSGGRRVGSMFNLFGRRRRRNSTAAKKQQQQDNEQLQQQQREQLMKQLASSTAAAAPVPTMPQNQQQHLHLVPVLTNATDRGQPVSFQVDESTEAEAADDGEMELDDEPSSMFESKLGLAATSRARPVLMADQETNKPFGANHKSAASAIDDDESESFESRQMEGEATEPQATYMELNAREGLESSESSSPAMHLLNDIMEDKQAIFGSRVVRNKLPVSSKDKLEEKRSASSSLLDTSSSKLKPTHQQQQQQQYSSQLLNGQIYGRGSKQQQAKIADEGESRTAAASNRPAPRSIAESDRPFRRGEVIDVDWPSMASDADYFPSGQQQHDTNQLQHKSRTSGARDNKRRQQQIESPLLHGEWSQPKASSSRVKNYVTSQMKLQFAQDYTAREGVPIYNNNVRVVGTLDRARGGSNSARSSLRPSEPSEGHAIGPEPDDQEEAEEASAADAGQEGRRNKVHQIDTSASTGSHQILSPLPKMERIRRLRPPTRGRIPRAEDHSPVAKLSPEVVG